MTIFTRQERERLVLELYNKLTTKLTNEVIAATAAMKII
jgi:hypothetical protein